MDNRKALDKIDKIRKTKRDQAANITICYKN